MTHPTPPPIYNRNFTDLPMDFASFLRAIWRRKVLIFSIWTAFMIITIISILTAVPVYEARGALELKALPAIPKSDLHSEASMSKVDEKKYMEAMKRLLSSHKLAFLVIKKLNLHKTGREDTSEQTEKLLLSEYVYHFHNNLSVSIEKGGVTGVINLSYLDTSPEQAEIILVTMVEEFWEILYERPEIAFSKERKHIKQMIDQAQTKLDKAYSSLNTFLSKNDIFFLENIDVMTKKDIEITSSQLLELSNKAEQTSHERISAETILKRSKTDPEGILDITQSNLIVLLKEELAKAEAEQANLTAIYTAKHSARKSISAKIRSIKKAIKKEKNNILETIRHKYETALSKEKEMTDRVEKLKQYVIQKKDLKGEYDAIEAEIEINRKVYQSVLQQYEALKIETVFPFTLNMIDPPLVSGKPVKPDKTLRTIIGFLLGILISISISLLIEFTNPGLRAPVEAERRTGLPLLGAVPPLHKRRELSSETNNKKLNQLISWPEFNQSFNSSAGMLLSKPGTCISISSPEENEGKVLAGIGISRQLMEAGKKVVLIDADFNSSKLDRFMNLGDDAGLLEILERYNLTESTETILEKQKPSAESAGGGKLFAIKPGLCKKNTTPLELVETPVFSDFMKKLQSEADYVIIITPSLLKEVAAYVINRTVSATVLVVRERQSSIKTTVRAAEVLHRIGTSIMGLIVTESDYYNK